MKDNLMGRLGARMGTQRHRVRTPTAENVVAVSPRCFPDFHSSLSPRQRLRNRIRVRNNAFRTSASAPGDTSAIVSMEGVRNRVRNVPVRFSSGLKPGAGQ